MHIFAHSDAKKRHGYDMKAPDMQLVCVACPLTDLVVVPMHFNFLDQDSLFPKEKDEAYYSHSVFGVCQLMHPRSRGSITLASADPLVAPNIDPNYLADPYDAEACAEGLVRLKEIFENEVFEIDGHKVEMPTSEDFGDTGEFENYVRSVREYTLTVYHPGG